MSLLFTLFQSSLRIVAAAVTGIALYYFARRFIRPQEYPFPPGPPAKPIFGNYFDLSKDKDWFTPDLYRQLSKKYESPILSLWVNGTHVIVVNTAEAVKDLFVTRGQNYAARGRMNVVHTISDMHWFTAMMQPNEEWKQNRKALTMNYKQTEYRGASTRSAHTMLRALLSSPDNFLEHFRRMNTATTMAITYGLDMDDGKSEKYVDIGKAIMHVLWDSSSSNAISVELLPRSLTFPKIFPGINYKTNPGKDMLEIPFEAAKRSIAEGRAKPSVVTNMLAQARTAKDEELASFTGANIYLSSANKVNAPVGAFVRAMLAYPEVQRRAQKDIDTLLDGSRLPELSDGPSLPYIDAIVKEVLRWHVVAKFGAAPRAVVDDDVYKGYLLPKGAIIIPNIWAILHNPEEFPEPEKFKPERWFERPPGDFPFAVFGFGPRACPGVTFSRDMLWITFASILATFDIEPVLDYAGKPKIPNDDEGWGYKLFSYADPFEAKFAPRSDAAKQLVHATASEEPLTSG